MKIKITVKKLEYRHKYFAIRFTDVVILTKVKYLGSAGDASVFLTTKLIPSIGERKITTTKILANYRFQRCEFPIDDNFYIPFKHFLKMKNTLC
jgi:hypothetical protein